MPHTSLYIKVMVTFYIHKLLYQSALFYSKCLIQMFKNMLGLKQTISNEAFENKSTCIF